jgi:hypothetical protein
MFGASEAGKALGELSRRFAAEVAARLPRQPLTKSSVYVLVKQVAGWLGAKLTKDTFAKALAKIIPVLGGLVSGTITWLAFTKMSGRLRDHLESLRLCEPPATPTSTGRD